MKIDKAIYKYVEYEVYHYEQYKEEIKIEREQILEGYVGSADGMPRGNAISNPTEQKGIRLIESTSLLAMQRIIRAVDNALGQLTPLHEQIFSMYYMKNRRDRYKMCDDLHVSYDTFNRYKNAFILCVAKELGINL